jgi:hypothetical protein
MRGHRLAEGDDAMLVEVGDRVRPAMLGDIGRGREQVEMDREEPALDEVGLLRLA